LSWSIKDAYESNGNHCIELAIQEINRQIKYGFLTITDRGTEVNLCWNRGCISFTHKWSAFSSAVEKSLSWHILSYY